MGKICQRNIRIQTSFTAKTAFFVERLQNSVSFLLFFHECLDLSTF
jgi:hypothetical protein